MNKDCSLKDRWTLELTRELTVGWHLRLADQTRTTRLALIESLVTWSKCKQFQIYVALLTVKWREVRNITSQIGNDHLTIFQVTDLCKY